MLCARKHASRASTLWIVFSLGVFFLGLALFGLDHVLRYRELPGDDGVVPRVASRPLCRNWHRDLEYRFGDGQSMELSCEDFRSMPGESVFVDSGSGSKIHYRIPESALPDDAPLWLHVHGVTGSWLSAGKYRPLAEKLGYRLVAMDLSNHGQSSNDGQGAYWGCRENEDVLAVVGDLRRRFPHSSMLVSASSMGTVAVMRAEPRLREFPVSLVLLESPFPGLLDVLNPFIRPFAWATLKMREISSGGRFEICSAQKELAAFQIPAILVTVASDRFVPTRVSRGVFESLLASTPKAFRGYEKGIHTLAYNSNAEDFELTLGEFLVSTESSQGARVSVSKTGGSVSESEGVSR